MRHCCADMTVRNEDVPDRDAAVTLGALIGRTAPTNLHRSKSGLNSRRFQLKNAIYFKSIATLRARIRHTLVGPTGFEPATF
jgi:hypothetical protein